MLLFSFSFGSSSRFDRKISLKVLFLLLLSQKISLCLTAKTKPCRVDFTWAPRFIWVTTVKHRLSFEIKDIQRLFLKLRIIILNFIGNIDALSYIRIVFAIFDFVREHIAFPLRMESQIPFELFTILIVGRGRIDGLVRLSPLIVKLSERLVVKFIILLVRPWHQVRSARGFLAHLSQFVLGYVLLRLPRVQIGRRSHFLVHYRKVESWVIFQICNC